MKRVMHKLSGILMIFLLVLNCSCATVIRGTTHEFSIKSDVPTRVVITGDKDGQVTEVMAPGKIELKRKQTYTVDVYADGYEARTFKVDSKYDLGWLLIGDILVAGGVLGLIIDSVNGSAYTMDPKALDVRFADQSREVRVLDEETSLVDKTGYYFICLGEEID